jgi:hypothetical protein
MPSRMSCHVIPVAITMACLGASHLLRASLSPAQAVPPFELGRGLRRSLSFASQLCMELWGGGSDHVAPGYANTGNGKGNGSNGRSSSGGRVGSRAAAAGRTDDVDDDMVIDGLDSADQLRDAAHGAASCSRGSGRASRCMPQAAHGLPGADEEGRVLRRQATAMHALYCPGATWQGSTSLLLIGYVCGRGLGTCRQS